MIPLEVYASFMIHPKAIKVLYNPVFSVLSGDYVDKSVNKILKNQKIKKSRREKRSSPQ